MTRPSLRHRTVAFVATTLFTSTTLLVASCAERSSVMPDGGVAGSAGSADAPGEEPAGGAGGGGGRDEQPVVFSFVPYWRADTSALDYEKLTHLAYFWVYPNPDGSVFAGDVDLNALRTMREGMHRAGGKALISVGKAEALAATMPDAELRAKFVGEMLSFVEEHQLDGVDVDWERFDLDFPNPRDVDGYGAFFAELCEALHRTRRICTADIYSSGYSGVLVPDEVLARADLLNAMLYDYHGSWSKVAAHHASMTDAVDGLRYWTVTRRVPASKLTFGIPMYGRAFGGAVAPGEPFEDAGSRDGGVWTYAEIDAAIRSGELESTSEADGTYATSRRGKGEVVFFDGPSDVERKWDYAVENGLAGIMFWEVTMDATGDASLLRGVGPSGED